MNLVRRVLPMSVRNRLRPFVRAPNKLDYARMWLACLVQPEGFRLLKSPKVHRSGTGKLDIDGRLHFYSSHRSDLLVNSGQGILQIGTTGAVHIHGEVRLAGTCRLKVKGQLSIHDRTYINPNTLIICQEQVTIGEGCAIAWDCLIMDTDYHPMIEGGVLKPKTGAIHIGDHVWIGVRCIILKNVRIGDGAVIAAGSVVTRDIPAKCLAGGVPARILKEDVEWTY